VCDVDSPQTPVRVVVGIWTHAERTVCSTAAAATCSMMYLYLNTINSRSYWMHHAANKPIYFIYNIQVISRGLGH